MQLHKNGILTHTHTHIHTHTHTRARECKGGLCLLSAPQIIFVLATDFFPLPTFWLEHLTWLRIMYIEQLCRKSGGKLCNVMCPGKWAKADWQLDEYALVGLNVTQGNHVDTLIKRLSIRRGAVVYIYIFSLHAEQRQFSLGVGSHGDA